MKQQNFAKLKNVMNVPDLLELQKVSYNNFLQENVEPENRKLHGLHQAFMDVFGDAETGEGISSSDGSLVMQYLHYTINNPKITENDAKSKDLTYGVPLRGTFRLLQKLETGKIKELSQQEVYLCDIPKITNSGSFIINGAERVVVSQIHRSPGVIFEEDEEKVISHLGKKLFKASVIPYRGAWLDFEFDLNNILYVHIDKKRKIPATVLLKAIGIESTSDIIKIFYNIKNVHREHFRNCIGMTVAEDVVDKKTGEVIREALQDIREEHVKVFKEKVDHVKVVDPAPGLNDLAILLTLKADQTSSKKEAIDLIYKILRSPEFITPEIAEKHLDSLLFKTKRYDLTSVGRYKINKKFAPLFNELTKNHACKNLDFSFPGDKKRCLTREDIICTMKHVIALNNGIDGYEVDDIDHLGNRRVRSVGELLENQIRIGLLNLVRITREKMNTADKKTVLTPRILINATPLVLIIKKFFGTSQLSQFMDQTNPLAELTHKRRFSALGPGGLHRKRAGFEVRDVHHTHYGRVCPIETPEGPNIGLITSMACYARVNNYGLLETPYRKVDNGKVTDKIDFLTAVEEDNCVIAQANTPMDKSDRLDVDLVSCRHGGDVKLVSPKKVDYIDISAMQIVSISTALIPFLEHDDANRALMGANMQRQAVPLLITEYPNVITGIEDRVASDSCAVIMAKRPGEILSVDSEEIAVYTEDGEVDIYNLRKYQRTNQDTAVNHIPVVNKQEKVRKNELLADGPSTSEGYLSLGKNVNVAFMSWEGFNFEDAILISERLVKEDVFTSIHVQEFQVESRDTKIGPEEITRDIPNVGAEDLLNLDEHGIIRAGTEVGQGDILVGKTAPKGEQQVTMEERLLKAIFGKKAEDVVDVSLRVPPGVKGKVMNIQILNRWEKPSKKKEKTNVESFNEEYRDKLKKLRAVREDVLSTTQGRQEKAKIEKYYRKKEEQLEEEKKRIKEQMKFGNELPITVNKVVKVYIASIRKVQVGDKLAGRHGNKGVVAKILPDEDMPYMPDGTPIDVVLSPLSIPSRMNVGQLLETMLGWSSSILGVKMVCPVFDGASERDVIEMIRKAKEYLKSKGVKEEYMPTDDCRIALYDGRTGEPFMEKITIGNMYLMKLVHLVEDKIHARSTGPYSLITRQPLGGKAQFGGQRFGEMEVWAIEGYGAAHTLQEFLTVKSDDVSGRTKVYESIIKGEVLSETGTPESFKVLVKELQGLGLNIELISSKKSGPGKDVPGMPKPGKEKVLERTTK